MKVGILGCRGIPNSYGGFEQFAEYLSEGLVKLGHSVSVYNSHTHPYKHDLWNGVDIIHAHDPEVQVGTFGQFIYDYNCIRDSHKRAFDVILQLGYTSSSVWFKLHPKNVPVITNMDGLEWLRTKYSTPVKKFLKYAEKLAALNSNFLVSDSLGIQHYLKERYSKESTFIPYGAHLFHNPSFSALKALNLQIFGYDMLIARLEPENSIETILEGYTESDSERPLLVIGDFFTKYGYYLRETFTDQRIKFIGKIYNINTLNNLRFFSHLYFHGHTVGGTNPSLLEAMASNALVCAHDNVFNRSILDQDAFYFESANDVTNILSTIGNKNDHGSKIDNNRDKIAENYSWSKIIKSYETLMLSVLNKKEADTDRDSSPRHVVISEDVEVKEFEKQVLVLQ